ncbi:MAG: ribonuclease E inhibitor RraB [Burkholderiales bacterium]|nr:MAG: ribonuclease E inhibitor RraB [Burkholderiales bacterium]
MKIASLLLFFVLGAVALPAAAQSVAEQQDAIVIENLRSAGSDITKPHSIDFFLYFPRKGQAKAAATEILELGYTVVELEKSPERSEWSVHATRTLVPELETMKASTRELEKLATEHGGAYDGWGTSIVK